MLEGTSRHPSTSAHWIDGLVVEERSLTQTAFSDVTSIFFYMCVRVNPVSYRLECYHCRRTSTHFPYISTQSLSVSTIAPGDEAEAEALLPLEIKGEPTYSFKTTPSSWVTSCVSWGTGKSMDLRNVHASPSKTFPQRTS